MLELSLRNDNVDLSVVPEFGGSLSRFKTSVVGGRSWIDLFQNSGGNPNLGNLAFFPMAPWAGRLRSRDAGKWGIINHPHEHALHAVLRRTRLKVIEANNEMVKLAGTLESTQEMTVISKLSASVEITLIEEGFEYGVEVTNVGDEDTPVILGTHMMCLKDPWGTGELVQVSYQAKKWWPPAADLAVPEGTVGNLPTNLERTRDGVMGPNWDHCLTDLTSSTVEMYWPKTSALLKMEDVQENCGALQVWHSADQKLCAAEFQTGVADSFRHIGDPNFPVKILRPGQSQRILHRFRIFFVTGC